jgi:hypothetical protein
MKKIGMLFGAVLVLCLVSNSYGMVEYNLLDPTTVVRGTGEPFAQTITFYSEFGGQATIRLANGNLLDSEMERVSSSTISLNDLEIFGPSEFNQNVDILEKDINLNVGQNTLDVVLKGKPGGTIILEIIQTVVNVRTSKRSIVLESVGDQSQIQVFGELFDNTPVEISNPIYGTSFSVLDENLASVSPAGLVTAIGNGRECENL